MYQIVSKTTDADVVGKSLDVGSVVHEELVEITEVDEDFDVIGTDGDGEGEGEGEDIEPSDQIFV